MSSPLSTLYLKKGEDRRLRAGHLWLYSNEIDTRRSPLTGFASGELVQIADQRDSVLAIGYVNPHSLISARVLSKNIRTTIDSAWLLGRMQRALQLRSRFYAEPCYRLIYGESDGLPGLVVDRFNDTLVVQITTAGMEALTDAILDALQQLCSPNSIILRNDVGLRELEGLPLYVKVHGDEPQSLDLIENGLRYHAPLQGGQKTGWFYDHAANRRMLQSLASGRRVLDVFSYMGAWAMNALAGGATSATCVDSSESALEYAMQNAKLNGFTDKLDTLHGDAFEVLKQLHQDKHQYDMVIVDPPAFVKRRKDLQNGAMAYQRLNKLAINLLAPEGLLVSASCSYHMPRERLLGEIKNAASRCGRYLQLIAQGHQGPDHPIHPAMPETEYLKAFICRVV